MLLSSQLKFFLGILNATLMPIGQEQISFQKQEPVISNIKPIIYFYMPTENKKNEPWRVHF